MDGDVYSISITRNAEGDQAPGLVFRKPEEGYVYKRGYVVGLDSSGNWFDPTNFDGDLPHRERSSDDEDLGLTWQFPK